MMAGISSGTDVAHPVVVPQVVASVTICGASCHALLARATSCLTLTTCVTGCHHNTTCSTTCHVRDNP